MGSVVFGSELDGSGLDGSEFDGSEFDKSGLEGSEFDGSEFDGSEFDGSEFDGSEFDGSETSEPLSCVSGSDGPEVSLSPTVEGFGVLLGLFARMPEAGAATAATEAVGKT